MKTQYILPALLALTTATVTTQVIASGLIYDPYENYYSEFYGINYDAIAKEAIEKATKASSIQLEQLKENNKPQVDSSEFSDPANFYNW